jgi:hypothetical protein
MSVFELVLALVGTYSLLLVFYVLTGRGYIAEAYISSSKQLIYNDQLSSFHIIRFDNYICSNCFLIGAYTDISLIF